MTHPKPAFVGLDIETTGMDPDTRQIIELGIVIFDQQLNPIPGAVRSWRIGSIPDESLNFENMDVFVMHLETGLLKELIGNTDTVGLVEGEAVSFLESFEATGLPMLGSSITFDRRFLARHMPALLDAFHYRSLDATSVMLAQTIRGIEVEHDSELQDRISTLRDEMAENLEDEHPMIKHRVIYDVLHSAATAAVLSSPRQDTTEDTHTCPCRDCTTADKYGLSPVRLGDALYIGAPGDEAAHIPVVVAPDVSVELLANDARGSHPIYRVNVGIISDRVVYAPEEFRGRVSLREGGVQVYPPADGPTLGTLTQEGH